MGSYPNKFFTTSDIVLPSALPASSLLAAPITLPISLTDVAPNSRYQSFQIRLNLFMAHLFWQIGLDYFQFFHFDLVKVITVLRFIYLC